MKRTLEIFVSFWGEGEGGFLLKSSLSPILGKQNRWTG